MGVLSSRLFTEGDTAVTQKLEDCATGRPSEIASHFSVTANSNGEHIRRVKQALRNAIDNAPDLKGIAFPAFTIDTNYDGNFAKAIAKYKELRGIKNFAGKIDDIVGIKTIRSLDDDNRRHRSINPPEPHPHKDITLENRVNRKNVLMPESEKDDPPLLTIGKLAQAAANPDQQVVDAGSVMVDTSFKVTRIDITSNNDDLKSQDFLFTFGPASPNDVFIFRDKIATERVTPAVAQQIYDHPGHFIFRPRKPGTSGS